MPINNKDNEPKANGDVPAANDNALTTPDWVKRELFEDLLNEHVENFKSISDFKAFPGLKPGENYATVMLRVEIVAELNDGNKQNLSFMLKTAHTSDAYLDMIKEFDMFEIERLMYSEVVPEFSQMYRDAGKEVKFGANFYKLKDHTENVLLEDLRPRGFKNTNRLEGLDMEHITHALKKLAQWHAASATRIAVKGQYAEILSNGYFIPGKTKQMKEIIDNMTKHLLTCMHTYEGIDEDILNSVEKAQKNMFWSLYDLARLPSDEFRVLNHGDCWSNNIMFQYDDAGNVKETYFVDYQEPKYGSPAQDLLYMIVSSAAYDIKVKEFDNLIRIYYDQLKESLELLKYPNKMPLLKEIHMSLYKYGLWGFLTTSYVLGAVLCDPTDNANFDNFIGETQESIEFKNLMYSNARYRKHMEMILPWLRNRGALEV